MIIQVLHCPHCQGTNIVDTAIPVKASNATTAASVARDVIRFCSTIPIGQSLEVKEQIVEMAMNASGIRERKSVEDESHYGDQRAQKKNLHCKTVNRALLAVLNPEQVEVEILRAEELNQRRGLSSELDKMWSFVKRKSNPRWLWHAIDHHTGAVLAYVFGRRQDKVFLKLKALLESFGITRFYTDGWGAY